jgi:hypothetical protein
MSSRQTLPHKQRKRVPRMMAYDLLLTHRTATRERNDLWILIHWKIQIQIIVHLLPTPPVYRRRKGRRIKRRSNSRDRSIRGISICSYLATALINTTFE